MVGLYDFIRRINKKNLKNYVEIFVDADIKKIIKFKKKRIYQKDKNLVGIDIKAEFPRKPDIIIKNNLKIKKNVMKKILVEKIIKKLRK